MHLTVLPAVACRPFWLCALICCLVLPAPPAARADTVVVFNEIMYHPTNAALAWVELHNQNAVDVDLSGWSLAGAIAYQFAEGTVIPGKGYLVVAASPADLQAAAGLTNVLGPFAGQLPSAGGDLELRNRNQRLMDSITYGVDGDWPVGADGSGVSLAKRDEDAASGTPGSWTVSALAGGTPGRRNFAASPFDVTNTTPLLINSAWRFDDSGNDLGSAWQQSGFDNSAWVSGQGLFRAGSVAPPVGSPQSLPTVFNTGVGPNGAVLSPGSPDPHYLLTLSAQSVPPPPSIPATVIQNHPAWAANDAVSSWIGPVNPGTVSVAGGDYNYRTTFSLDGFDPSTASLTMSVGADNRLTNVLFNGVSKPITYVGFATLSAPFSITSGFVPGLNTLDFFTVNDTTSPNPAGFRLNLAGTGRRLFPVNTTLSSGRTDYYFRATFALGVAPQLAALQLRSVIADGAVFYLNGNEVLRWNMPAGPITAGTLAVSNVPAPVYLGPFALPTAPLVTGTNVLAVEVHPAAGGANHLLFGADLSLSATNVLVPPPVTLAFNELAAATNAGFWFELINYGSTSLDVRGLRGGAAWRCGGCGLRVSAPRRCAGRSGRGQSGRAWLQPGPGRPPLPLQPGQRQRAGWRGRPGGAARPFAGRHGAVVVSDRADARRVELLRSAPGRSDQ